MLIKVLSDALMDDKDIWILKKLQSGKIKSYKVIAEELDMPVTTVYNRVKKMEREGVILGYKPIIDASKLGFSTTCFLLITVRFKDDYNQFLDVGKIADEIARDPRVLEVHIVAGDWDILVKIKTKDAKSVGQFINNKLRYLDGIDKCTPCICFNTVKETFDLPL